ncbi:MAG TPA: DUF5680 domain-containing protein [Ktedonobacterales bacterium]|nr:DUF5680 domain-containing protein [Ktedonobacterales bacterium]
MCHGLLPADCLPFLVEAKRAAYDYQGNATMAVEPLLPGAHQFEYAAGPYLYRDIYVGMARFAGQEMIYFEDRPIWSMSYAGGVVPALAHPDEVARVYAFLRAALCLMTPDRPFRGPALFREGELEYHDECTGELEAFHGHETIRHAGRTVYTLRYGGGALR